jgi:O-antigen biosynthesis protein WbqP
MPRLPSTSPAAGPANATAKRLFDLALACLAGIPAVPVVMLCAAAIRLTSPGPAIFRQQRVGRDGRTFTCLKLRTMHAGTAHAPSHETGPAAITPLGRWLRRLKFDELPQLWNVVTGDMSLVGPRPCLPTQTELIEARARLGVDRIRPGITGVSQIAGLDMSEPQRLAAMDATYLGDMSIGRDVSVLARTVLGVFRRKDAIGDAADPAAKTLSRDPR